MIRVYPISSKLRKYCSHCDCIAVFEIWFCNEKIVQQSAGGCFCRPCMERLKAEIDKAVTNACRTVPDSDRINLHWSFSRNLKTLLECFWHEFPDEWRYCNTDSLKHFVEWVEEDD